MKPTVLFLALGAICVGGGTAPVWAKPAPAPPIVVRAAAPTQRVIVRNFDPPVDFQGGGDRLGSAVGDMMLTALVTRGVDVIERATLVDQEKEKELGQDGTTTADSTAQLGQVLGGQIQLVGKITQFGMEERKASGGGILGMAVGIGGGNKKTARVKLDGRLVDIRTGRILAVATGEGVESKSGFALGGGNLFSWVAGVSFQSSEWTESQLGKAARAAVEDFATKILPQIPAASTISELAPLPVKDYAADTSPGMTALRKLTFVVLVPESQSVATAVPLTDGTTPALINNVPSPTAETAITKALLAAGMKVKDDARLSQLRGEKWVGDAQNGAVDAETLHSLQTRFGADVLIVGSALAERNAKDAMDRNSVFSSGRVSVKAIRMDTATIIASDEARSPGRDLNELAAGKAAIQSAAQTLAPRLLDAMAASMATNAIAAQGDDATMELEIKGFANLRAANDFVSALGTLADVKSAELTEWRGKVLYATVVVPRTKAKKVGLWFETEDKLAPFGVHVDESSAEKVTATATDTTSDAPKAAPAPVKSKPKPATAK